MATESQPIEIDRPPVGWRFWLLWVLANAFGWILGVGVSAVGIIALALAVANWPHHLAILGAAAAVGVAGGAILGTTQRLALHRQVPLAGSWVLVSALGWGAAFTALVAVALSETMVSLVAMVAAAVQAVLLGGAVLGAAQWFVLRRHVARVGWWVLGTIVGTCVFWGAVTLFWGLLARVDMGVLGLLLAFVVPLVGGALYGSITGILLIWLLRRHGPES